jgi:deoxyribodipyrimidine photo-lyase
MTSNSSPILVWFRRDLRLSDHAALTQACATGRPVIPVFIRDGSVDALGAAPKWRMGQAVEAFDKRLRLHGSRLILRSGDAQTELQKLIAETGAGAVLWSRLYDPDSQTRDAGVKAALRGQGVEARSFPGHVMFEPWTVETGSATPYKVYSPFWRAVRGRDVPQALPAPDVIATPQDWPSSETLSDWQMGDAMQRGAAVMARYSAPGEDAAQARLQAFLGAAIEGYKQDRDFPAKPATSGLSEYLTYGEISPAQIWHAGQAAMIQGRAGAEHFLKELVWREFAYHLMYHFPHMLHAPWREGWESFPWQTDENHPDVLAWKQGRTGVQFVDAAMREMYVTGRMHNRARMIVASFLTKHLMTDWRIGMRWFEDCLTDWDPASNAMGWQWVAGCGPDAAPFFRIFNPDTQLKKFDPNGSYASRWIAEGQLDPPQTALDYFEAVPKSWALGPRDTYPLPSISLDLGRKRALGAYENRVKLA